MLDLFGVFEFESVLNTLSERFFSELTDISSFLHNALSGYAYLYGILKSLVIICGAFLFYKGVNFAIKKIAPHVFFSKWPINHILFSNRFYSNVARYISLSFILKLSPCINIPQIEHVVILACRMVIVVVAAAIAFSLLDSILDYLNRKSISKKMPVKSLTQLGKVVTSIVCFVIIISLMIDKSPAYLIGSLGALSAVVMLFFRDSILGLVHGVQLGANRIVSVGDKVQSGEIEGTVEDISLTVVKIRNYDGTITSIPCSELVTKPLKNWAYIHDKSRRIKRSINVDANSVRFISDDEIMSLSELKTISTYLLAKFDELKNYNYDLSEEDVVNKRRLTNLGTFRIFIESYLKMNSQIISDDTLIVKYGQSSEKGIPIEICCFTKTGSSINYEQIQSDIFDYIFAVLPLFGLRVFQLPTGHDLNNISLNYG